MTKTFKPPTLLIISDNPATSFWIKKYFSDQFFIIEAHTRSQTFEIVHTSHLDFILLDGALEESDPLKLCKEIRQIIKNHWLPIILITGRLKKSYREKAIEAGVSDFLNNQLDEEEFETRIATGKRTNAMREKTEEVSSILQSSKQEISKSYFKTKVWMHDQALRLLALAKIEKINVTLLVIKLDHFSEIEQEEGVRSANELLSQASDTMSTVLREGDLLIPSTHGHFILLLPNTTKKEGNYFAEHLRKVIEKNRFQGIKGERHLTASIALSPLETNEGSFNRMIETALKTLGQSPDDNLIISIDLEES